jgi:hypothetical protein
VLLVSKPDTKEKRLVLDYCTLNEFVGHMNWPLPNISHIIDRIGALKPKKNAKFDITKGYWQLDLAPAVRQATAFITWMGIFAWNRIPMGLQPAASYFQYCMLMIVLAGICEGYIDDIIVHGQDDSYLLVNLQQVFERCRQKSKIGLDRIDWVGHQLDAEGIHFSAEQLSEVAEFPTPVGAKGLRSFLGLANYFRDHVLTWSVLCGTSLRSMTSPRSSSGPSLQSADFGRCKWLFVTVPNCIFSKTSLMHRSYASDYGYGAYLCQIVGERKHPVLFMSKSFHGAELNWKTQDKECGAIYKAMEKFQY